MESDLTMIDLLMAAFMSTIVVFIIGLLFYFHYKARKMVYTWAARNNYEVLKLRYRFIFKGPWTWWGVSNKRQKVFYASFLNDQRKIENAYVKCGHFWKGLTEDVVEVKWEEMRKEKIFK